jgi:hypothetical protein
MKTKRIIIEKGERAEIAIRRKNAPQCDGKNIGGYTDLVLVGPCSVCIVIFKKKNEPCLEKAK